MNHPGFIVCVLMGNSFSLIRVNRNNDGTLKVEICLVLEGMIVSSISGF